MTRAIIITLFSCVSIFFYGAYAENFNNVIPTMCVFTVLFGLYRLRPVLDAVFVTQILLLAYHVFFLHTFQISSDSLERDRMALQLLSWLVLNGLEYYSIYRTVEFEEEVTELNAQIDKVQKIKDDFVANTSHELRTPINTVSGMSEILLQEDLPETAHNRALDIQMTGIELQTIVTDILDYAALEAGTHTLSPRAYNITSTINDVMNMTVFQNREKNLQLIFDCDPRIPCLLYGDEQQLRRVMNNLIGNAIKFTNEGGVVVSVGFRPEEYGVNLIVSIKDTGIGMSRENMEKIFQDFYQADPDRNRNVEGMGLGLTISSALIKKMGGFLTVRSQEGKGSEFTFSIPQEVRDERPCIAVTHPERVRAIWYFNAESTESLMRDDYVSHIGHISEHLDITVHRAASLGELKRRLRQGQFTHLFIGIDEYAEDPAYFDEVSAQTSTILILDRQHEAPNNRMHARYTPYNALTLAELVDGGGILATQRKYQQMRHFEAPTAKVLVVDDNLMNLKVVEGLLRKYRIKITAANSGDEALAQIDSQDYDFVFMDHMMPGMDGIECFRKIRAKAGEYYTKVPIIALTANAIAGSREMFLEEGFDEFVAKPIDNAVLNQVLEDFIPDEKKIFSDVADSAGSSLAAGNATATVGAPAPVPGTPDAPSADPFDAMEGIDMDTALTYCGGSLEDFVELARIYCESSDKNLTDIQAYYAVADWKNYAILVHALKSSSKTIGAMELSEVAYTEEMAAKEADEATIRRHHDQMMEEYRRILGLLHANPQIFEPEADAPAEAMQEEEEDQPARLTSLDITEWRKISADVRNLLETFEADAVEDYVGALADRSYKGKALPDLLGPIMDKVAQFDFPGAIEELESVE
ncbi:MAG: response regulator [Eggerthellaceae bacterium]|nr:response regulator [Eggerthellaceae bacterium]